MKRLIPRDGAEWLWLACIVLELVVTVAHATAGDWLAALNSALWAGAIFIIAATTRAWKTARRRVAELEARPKVTLWNENFANPQELFINTRKDHP